MDPKQEGEQGKSCCRSGCHCCGAKALAALVLLLLGGVIGYLAGAHCGYMKRMCPVMNPPALSTPAR